MYVMQAGNAIGRSKCNLVSVHNYDWMYRRYIENMDVACT